MKLKHIACKWLKGCLLLMGFPLTIGAGACLLMASGYDYDQTFYHPEAGMMMRVTCEHRDPGPATVYFGRDMEDLQSHYVKVEKKSTEAPLLRFYIIEDSDKNVKKIYLLDTENALSGISSPKYPFVSFSRSKITGGFGWKAVEDSIRTYKLEGCSVYNVSLDSGLYCICH